MHTSMAYYLERKIKAFKKFEGLHDADKTIIKIEIGMKSEWFHTIIYAY